MTTKDSSTEWSQLVPRKQAVLSVEGRTGKGDPSPLKEPEDHE